MHQGAALRFLTALLAGLSLSISGCGGGGGGDGGGGGGGGGPSGDAFSLSSTSVTFNASQGGAAPAPQVVNVTVNSGAVFFSTTHTGSMFGQTFALTGDTTGQITITPGGTVTAGSFSGAITVNGCSNFFGPC